MALSVSRLVRVVVNLSPLAAARRSFGALLAAGDSDVISGLERIREYSTYEAVLADFGVDAPETEAAALYFGQTPKPKTFFAGRWLREVTSAFNKGGILTATQQLLSNWTAISSGGFVVLVDGVSENLSGLDFTGATNLNGVASIISDDLSVGTCIWNGFQFIITSNTTGAGVKASGDITLDTNPSYGAQASATIELTGNPANGNSVVIQGTTVTFVSGTPSGNQVQIGSLAADTAASLQTFLEDSSDVNLALMTYNTIGVITTLTARAYGVAGNSYTLTKTGANISVSGATFSGGIAPDTLTVYGTVITFVHAVSDSNQVIVGPTVTATAANLQLFLSLAGGNINLANYTTEGTTTFITYKTTGTDGNSFTLAKSSSHITLSGANLTGGAVASSVSYVTPGSGTDISEMLKLTSSTNVVLVPGYSAETPAECAAALANKSANWYGLMFAASEQPDDDENVDVAAVIEALDLKRTFGITEFNTNALDPLVTDDLASRMVDLGYKQTFGQFTSTTKNAIASLFGRMFSVNFSANRSTITLMYKQEPGIDGEELSETQANTLKAKRLNVFVNYVNDTKIIQYGTMFGPAWIDEVHGLDWLQDAIQNSVYNTLYTSKTKIPQTDAGVNVLVNAINKACDDGVNNGLIAPGVWNADGFGQLSNGDYLKEGYYTYAQSVDLQSQADREARIAPPIISAIKLAGAIQEVDVLVNVNR